MCGGSDPFQTIGDLVTSIDPGPAIGQGLAESDTFVNREIPGGYALPAIVAAAVVAPELLPELAPELAPELMGPTYGELGYTGLGEGMMGPTYAEMGYTGLNAGEAIAAADAAAYAASNGTTLADAYKALSTANQIKNLGTTGYNLLTGKGVPRASSALSGLGSYGSNLTGDITGGATSPNLTPDLTKGNIDFTLMGAPTAAKPQTYTPAPSQMMFAPQQAPTFAQGGEFEEEPQFYSEGGLGSMDNRYVQGEGDGTSDSVNAKLADGEFVIPADVVAKLGNGSNNAGASVLDQFLSTIREHKQENGTKLEPDSKGPLGYLLEAKKKAKA